MTVRHSLLALLATGNAYGYQLRQEFLRRTGEAWPLNVGQVYTTLDRLERDGLVEQAGVDAEGHAMFAITAAGRAEAQRWLASAGDAVERSETATKLALALSLPGVDADGLIAALRRAARQRQHGEGVVGLWAREQAEAELRWLDACEALTVDARGLGSGPRRGRPARTRQ